MTRPIVALLTDFGASYYVGQLKGKLAGLIPDATVIDLTHEVKPQCIVQGSIILSDSLFDFPIGTIVIAVVDPGVGTERSLVAMEVAGRWVIGPDNGLLTPLTQQTSPTQAFRISHPRFWKNPISQTFHGRDIMVPVAAELVAKIPPASFGDAVDQLHPSPVNLPQIGSRSITGETLFSDSYGNLITNVRRADLMKICPDPWEDPPRIEWREHQPDSPVWCNVYGENASGQLVALIGSSDRMEISQVNGSASQRLGRDQFKFSVVL